MKKTFLVLPLAILLANCSSTRSTTSTSSNTGMNASTANSTTSGATGSGTMENTSSMASSSTAMSASSSQSTMSASTSGNMTGSASSTNATKNWSSGNTPSAATVNWDVYDRNNYMMNPEKYRKPYELDKTGGWTYNKDWRRNTNFTADAVGQWQLELTPEVAANWMPDTRRPETYASFWTPEAVMARYQASMAAAQKTRDSLAALNAMANANTSAKRKSSLKNKNRYGANNMTTSTDDAAWSSGSGTTGSVGTGGSSSISTASTSTDSSSAMPNGTTVPFALTAINGNNFMLPTLNMYIDNGSFTAYTGCNNAVGTIIVNGSSLHFQEATPSSNVECIGGFDQSAFLDKLRRADSYDVVNNQFRLKQGDQVLMIFSKNAKSNL